VAAALGACAVVAIGGPASATSNKATAKPGVTKITAEFDRADKRIFFDGPSTVAAGDELKIVNNTNPRSIGPHTFSLVRKKDLPQTKNQIKACAKKFKGICGAIIKWHDVNVQTGEVGENPVEVGKNGWDQKGSLKRKGDSFVLDRGRGQKFKRPVTAPVGKTLYYICAVHPEMQGKITVVAGS
jgi:plastocyanin